MSTIPNEPIVWKEPPAVWVSLAVAIAIAVVLFHDGLAFMVRAWDGQEEYSYGYLIPFICLFLIWQKKETLRQIPFAGSWAGVGLTFAGVLFFLLGRLGDVYTIIQYSFVVVICGLTLAFAGWPGFKVIRIPLLVLVFMIPLPGFLNQTLSNELQLISSQLGVAVIRLFGISVFLEGNVVDLGSYKLQVAEACSGLRYLFPLMTFGFIAAYFFKAPMWKRALLFASTVPITILMNSFRIGVIGVTVDRWGPAMAEGFLHEFEGWVVFMVCTGVLLLEMWLLERIGAAPRPLRDAFGLTFPAPTPRQARIRYRSVPRPFYAAAVSVLVVLAVSYALPKRQEVIPPRKDFSTFPMEIAEWRGKKERLGTDIVDALNFDDYLMADYLNARGKLVNLYVGYYETQQADKVPHSPRACIPGNGWQISAIGDYTPQGIAVGGHPLRVNRLIIEKGAQRQLVYYWFQQRGRIITNEYLVKWYLFWDAVTRNRSDGSLVRFITTLIPGETQAAADRRLTKFVNLAAPQLRPYVPD